MSEIFGPRTIIPSPYGNPPNSGSMASNITSEPDIVDKMYAVSYAFSWTGTSPVGSISIQGSNDYSENRDGSVRNPGTWNTLTLNFGGSAVTSIPIAGNSGSGIVDMTATAIYALRFIYTAVSGTGTLTVTINAKG